MWNNKILVSYVVLTLAVDTGLYVTRVSAFTSDKRHMYLLLINLIVIVLITLAGNVMEKWNTKFLMSICLYGVFNLLRPVVAMSVYFFSPAMKFSDFPMGLSYLIVSFMYWCAVVVYFCYKKVLRVD